MSLEKFLQDLHSAIDLEPGTKLAMEMKLETLGNWDSMALISVISMLDLEYDVLASAETLRKCSTVGDIHALIGKR